MGLTIIDSRRVRSGIHHHWPQSGAQLSLADRDSPRHAVLRLVAAAG
jgi:hypothetical protein